MYLCIYIHKQCNVHYPGQNHFNGITMYAYNVLMEIKIHQHDLLVHDDICIYPVYFKMYVNLKT